MQQHHVMLSDDVRMKTFRLAIETAVKEGDVILDAGTGTGILAVMAAQAGAAKVYAVEKSRSINVARRLAVENGFEDTMTCIYGDVRKVDIPEKLDGVICEMLGFCGLGEGIIEILGYIRKNHLKPGGWMMPGKMKTFIVPINDPALYDETFLVNEDLGIKMESMKDEMAQDYWMRNLSRPSFVAEPQVVKEVDFMVDSPAGDPVDCLFKISESCNIHGLGSWFEAELAPGISIDTRPGPPFTHWSQVYFAFRHPIKAEKGDELLAGLDCITGDKGDIFSWCAELRRGKEVIDRSTQSGALSYRYLPKK